MSDKQASNYKDFVDVDIDECAVPPQYVGSGFNQNL